MADSFKSHLVWTGAAKGPTRDPSFSPDLRVSIGPIRLEMSSAPGFRGDASRANPEQLFVAAPLRLSDIDLSVFAARNGIVVVDYIDDGGGCRNAPMNRCG